MIEKEKIKEVLDILEDTYPEAECALDHKDVFQLIVAVALSAQTTDKSVNLVTPAEGGSVIWNSAEDLEELSQPRTPCP